jgi:diacylglycerol kinase family enzyme/membrane-associated phospholipid phosphatase
MMRHVARKPPSVLSLGIAAALLAAFVAWTLLVGHLDAITRFDHRAGRVPVAPGSNVGQIASALALVTSPILIYAALLVVAIWAFRNRMRNLAGALTLMVIFGYFGDWAAKFVIARPRPADALPLLSVGGSSYPSGHLVAATAGAIAVSTILVVTRRSHFVQLRWVVIGSLIIIVVAADRWVLAAHFVSDLIGGALFGALAVAAAVLVAGVSVVPPFLVPVPPTPLEAQEMVDSQAARRERCAVIYNPARISDWVGFRRAVEYEVRTRGWSHVRWLETTREDPGREMTQRAIAADADLVLAAGGDGTIRVVAAELAGTGIPFAIVPAGTGNLLAKNLGIPLDERQALEVAFAGIGRPIDVIDVTTDDEHADHFVVFAGIGIDAIILQDTNPELKRAVGSAAYFLTAARHANRSPVHATFTIDDREPFRRRAHVILLGNVGTLQANISLIPDAKPDDGLLDLLIASPRRASDWFGLIVRVLLRRRHTDERLDRMTGQRIRIDVAEGDHFELDGDPAGECHSLAAEVQPGSLVVRVPRR